MKKQDRSWVRPPNSMTKKSTQISYWVDANGEARLYTPEQLAICNILMNLNVLLNKSLTLAEKIKTIDKNVTVATLAQQDYAHFKPMETSVYGYFVELMAAAPDITFAEFLNFISQGNDEKAFAKLGKTKLKKVIGKKSPDVTLFYGSDKLLE